MRALLLFVLTSTSYICDAQIRKNGTVSEKFAKALVPEFVISMALDGASNYTQTPVVKQRKVRKGMIAKGLTPEFLLALTLNTGSQLGEEFEKDDTTKETNFEGDTTDTSSPGYKRLPLERGKAIKRREKKVLKNREKYREIYQSTFEMPLLFNVDLGEPSSGVTEIDDLISADEIEVSSSSDEENVNEEPSTWL